MLQPAAGYSGSSLGFHLSSLIAGGPAPLIAPASVASPSAFARTVRRMRRLNSTVLDRYVYLQTEIFAQW
jgi:hypothetical protein